MDPFAVLAIEPRFDLDLKAVEQRHRDLSRTLHPDRYAGAPAAERRLALGKAIEVNEAWRMLRDPVKRAEALLRRAGVEIGETAEPKASPELLMDMMEQREALGDAARRKDMGEITKLAEAMRGRESEILSRLGAALENGAPSASAVQLLGELRYVRRFLDEVAAIEETLA
jgi:molecular chaperone HscB